MPRRSLKLFHDIAPIEKQHPIYQMMKANEYAPERAVLENWAIDFEDRDGKFCYEFQTSFEPCLWELYLHAYLKELNAEIDFSFDAPDFVAKTNKDFSIEATIAAPPLGGAAPYGFDLSMIPKNFNEFNSESTIRICNSFSSKFKKYQERYSQLQQTKDKPFIIAIASFDRPFSHMAAMRPIISAIYGFYYDEEMTIESRSNKIISYNVDGVIKNGKTNIELGYFCSEQYSDISAVVFSSLATWGKIRALADNTNAKSIYVTYHPNPNHLVPIIKTTSKANYKEHLLDGLCVLHNPFAKRPLDPITLGHERIAQCFVKEDGELDIVAPEDFLLLRHIQSIKTKEVENINNS